MSNSTQLAALSTSGDFSGTAVSAAVLHDASLQLPALQASVSLVVELGALAGVASPLMPNIASTPDFCKYVHNLHITYTT
jgi:hypothetical protein